MHAEQAKPTVTDWPMGESTLDWNKQFLQWWNRNSFGCVRMYLHFCNFFSEEGGRVTHLYERQVSFLSF